MYKRVASRSDGRTWVNGVTELIASEREEMEKHHYYKRQGGPRECLFAWNQKTAGPGKGAVRGDGKTIDGQGNRIAGKEGPR